MNLSAEHYDAIMREYDDQRLANMRALNARTQEVYDRFPEIKQIDGQISDLAENFASSFTTEGIMTFEEYRRKLADLRMEKEALMKCYHISPETLQMQYRCPDCQDTGYIDNEKCHCFRQRIIDEMYQQSNLREILKENNQNNKKKVVCMNYNNFPRSNSCIRLTKRPESAVGCCSFGDFSSRDLNRTQRWFHIDRRDLSKNSRAYSNEYND